MEPDPGREDSVYDFLYVDERRIAVFLSQFSEYGNLTSLTRSVTETSTSSGGLGVAGFAKLDQADAEQTGQTRQFDPRWLAPLRFLDEAAKKEMLVRELLVARIGQLVLPSGRLALFDLGLMRNAWEVPAIRSEIIKNAVSQQSQEDKQRSARVLREAEKTISAGLDFLRILPHSILSSIRVGESEVWFSLREENMIVPAPELVIKHGYLIPGEWSAVGILDAVPNEIFPSEQDQQVEYMMAALSLGSLWEGIATIASIARTTLGRPVSAFGMTPLLIFREVSA